MTGLLFAAILLATLGCWAILVVTPADNGWRTAAVAAMSAAPALLFGSVVMVALRAAPAGDYRVALEAVSFAVAAVDQVTVGGGSEGDRADDLIVRGLPPGYLTFRPAGGTLAVELRDRPDDNLEEPSYGAVRVNGAKPFANSVLLAGRVTVGGRHPLVFDSALRRFGTDTDYPEISGRRQEIGPWRVPILRNLGADTVIYPLRYWARPRGSEESAADGRGAPLGSFLSFEGGFLRRSLYLTLVGDGTNVTAAGTVATYQRRIATLVPRQSQHFALYRLDYVDPAIDEERSRAQERRSFRGLYDEGRLTLVFDTPDVHRLPPEVVATLLERQGEKESGLLLTARDPRRNAPVAVSQMTLSFRQLGPRIQDELYSAIRVEGEDDCRLRVTTHTGTRCYALGDAFTVGDQAAAVLRITRMGVPWGIVAAMVTLLLISLTFPTGLAQDPSAAIVVSAAEVLLAVRLLIAFEGGLLDAAAAAALWESLVAFAVLPFALRVAWIAYGRTAGRALDGASLRNLVGRAIATSCVVAVTLWHAGLGWPASIALTAALVWVAPLVVASAMAWLRARILDPGVRRSLLATCVLGMLILVVRIAMWLGLGWKERISLFGVDLAVTAVYLPAVCVFFALVWQRYAEVGRGPLSWGARGIAALTALIGALLAVGLPFAVRDSGSVFVHLPAVLVLFALPLLSRRPTLRTVALGAGLLLLVGGHLALLFVPRLRGVDESKDHAQSLAYRAALSSETEAERFLEQRLRASTNDLRVMSHIAPHQLEEAGTSKAEGLVAQRRMLDRYSGRGLLGAGYLNVPLAAFRDTHLNDNLSAIHVLAPFGLAGGLGVIGLLAALGLLTVRHALRPALAVNQTPEGAIDGRLAFGMLCVWTFCLAGLYMFAANVGLVLFTGKNVYLLAAASKSDLIEGGILLLGALAGLREVAGSGS